jgi:hypothetical protein
LREQIGSLPVHKAIEIIHGLEKSQGTYALVVELVEDEDLSQRIARGLTRLDERHAPQNFARTALVGWAIAALFAAALAATLGVRYIIHRDLKPATLTAGGLEMPA